MMPRVVEILQSPGYFFYYSTLSRNFRVCYEIFVSNLSRKFRDEVALIKKICWSLIAIIIHPTDEKISKNKKK